MVLYTHVPGVSKRSRYGMKRLGREFTLLGHVLNVVAIVGSEEDDMAVLVGVRLEVNKCGANVLMAACDW